MNYLGIMTELFGIQCHTVAEACSYCKHNVGSVCRAVCRIASVHSHKSEIVFLSVPENTCRHKRIRRRDIRLLDKLAQFCRSLRKSHSAAEIDKRSFRMVYKLCDLLDISADLTGTGNVNRRLRLICSLFSRDILGDINEHRSRSAATGNSECLAYNIGKILNLPHNKVMLGYRHCNTGYIYLLEAVASDKRGCNVSRNGNHGNAVHICRCDSGDKICSSGTAC